MSAEEQARAIEEATKEVAGGDYVPTSEKKTESSNDDNLSNDGSNNDNNSNGGSDSGDNNGGGDDNSTPDPTPEPPDPEPEPPKPDPEPEPEEPWEGNVLYEDQNEGCYDPAYRIEVTEPTYEAAEKAQYQAMKLADEYVYEYAYATGSDECYGTNDPKDDGLIIPQYVTFVWKDVDGNWHDAKEGYPITESTKPKDDEIIVEVSTEDNNIND